MSREDFNVKISLSTEKRAFPHNLSASHRRGMPSHFLLDEKVTKESRLPNLCSFHRNKSLSAIQAVGTEVVLQSFYNTSADC